MLSSTPSTQKLSSHQNSSAMSSVLSGSATPFVGRSSYADSNASVSKPSRYTSANTDTNYDVQERYQQQQQISQETASRQRSSDIFGTGNHSNTTTPPKQRTYRNQSNVFNYADSSTNSVSNSGKGTPRKDPMASDIFFGGNSGGASGTSSAVQTPRYGIQPATGGYTPSFQSTSRRSTPGTYAVDKSNSHYGAEPYEGAHEDAALVDRFESFSTNSLASSQQRDSYHSNHSAASQPDRLNQNHQRSSIFDDASPTAAIRGSRRHFHGDRSTSDIFHQSNDSPAAIAVRSPRSGKRAQPKPADYEPSWSPKPDYQKSTSFSNIFGDPIKGSAASVAAAAEYTRSTPDLSRSNSKLDNLDRVGGVSSSDLNRDTRGKGRRQGQGQNNGSQIWF
ncbi:hypothetical protein BATDEDRAFT_34807 [Batrachochytrium dendrobatidis JAM81]|uniref:Uncharacterized protein n=2 Tax=Batrachochytrium dendrobatidis TaxID=109871 RepID=F4NZM4_BATDJ|nr:uncharacterized protein BATDEDRAFT_34807 [Batrachochytrium dendrobatidis JAM81]EGF81518.1 hypothetical protein BATDEDRAFT_34807 [Batrachochytrium dendrobatidis JAM81]KAJ8325986.1 hypothetical protein O5D80_005627 [Batrachochytrium dendrobatidis]KAK5669764.1 hypothetical protein QVD99_004148 [Batrachochytrium dendrobatidis]|eukprot:XP_006678011.1 hypothetical protein BATDEDRAFT_34807 [Batrachochytrium dendrobatidis JAM81]